MTPSFHRNLVWILVQRCGLVALGVVYVALVPEALGPVLFGKFTLVYSTLLWGMTVTECGAQATFTRNFEVHPRTSRHLPATFFLTQWVLSIGAGFLCAGVAGLLIQTGLLASVLFGMAACLACSGQAGLGVQLAEGHGARWGAGFLLRRSIGLVGILVGSRLGGWNGIATGILISEAVIFIAMLRWSGARLRRSPLSWPRFRPYLFYGLSFYLAGMVQMTWRYFGEWRVKSISGVEEVAYYGLAMGIYVAAEAALQQIVVLGAPYLSRIPNDAGMVKLSGRWRWGMVIGIGLVLTGVVLSPFLAEPVVLAIAGEDYLPSAGLLPWMALAILFYLPAAVCQSLALARGWRALHLRNACLRLGVLAVVTLPLGHIGGWETMAPMMCLSNVIYSALLMRSIFLSSGQMETTNSFLNRTWKNERMGKEREKHDS